MPIVYQTVHYILEFGVFFSAILRVMKKKTKKNVENLYEKLLLIVISATPDLCIAYEREKWTGTSELIVWYYEHHKSDHVQRVILEYPRYKTKQSPV